MVDKHPSLPPASWESKFILHDTSRTKPPLPTTDGKLLISLPLIGFLSSSHSLTLPGITSQVNYLHPSPCLRPCLHKVLQHHVAILCPLWKATLCRNQGERALPSFFTLTLLSSLEMSHPFLSMHIWRSFTNAKRFPVGCRVYSDEQNIVLPSRTLHVRVGYETGRKTRNPTTT